MEEYKDEEYERYKELEKRLPNGIKLNPIFKPMPNPVGTTFIWTLLTKRSLKKAIRAEFLNAKRLFI